MPCQQSVCWRERVSDKKEEGKRQKEGEKIIL